jgi:hypothetical protein
MILRTAGLLFSILLPACGGGGGGGGGSGGGPSAWDIVKAAAAPVVVLTSAFGTPYRQPLANLAWEDGIYITRDGLTLYAEYLPADAISWMTYSGDPGVWSAYRRGPDLGMDLSLLLHSDIAIATRASTAVPFSTWQLSNIAGAPYSQGAVQIVLDVNGNADLFMSSSNNDPPGYKTQLMLKMNTVRNPMDQGAFVSALNTSAYAEDNPHVERLSPTDLVLFYESEDVGGTPNMAHKIYYSLSTDNGASWSSRVDVSSVNTRGEQIQPHLYYDATAATWFLYFAGTDPFSGTLSILRMRQSVTSNWNSWTTEEVVVRGAGNALHVGEPSLTANGDLSFVVIYDLMNGSTIDRYDCDPWFVPRK